MATRAEQPSEDGRTWQQLTVVLYAVVLFFAGVSTRLRGRRLRWIVTLAGCAVLLGALAWIANVPGEPRGLTLTGFSRLGHRLPKERCSRREQECHRTGAARPAGGLI
jgi:hypothetical protein